MRPRSRLLLVASLVALVLAACGDATAGSPSATPFASPTTPTSDPASPSPTASPSDDPSTPVTPSASPSPSGPPAPAIARDTVVRSQVDGLRLREDPTTAAASLGTLANGAPSYVVDGPVMADGYTWYLLSGLGLPMYSGCAGPMVIDPWSCPAWFGWAAAGSPDGDAWLAPTELECPAWPAAVTGDIVYGVARVAYLACFGDEERTLVGYYPAIPDDAGLGGACAEVPGDLSWIACNLGYEHVNVSASDPFGSGFVFSVDPTSVTMPERGQWVRLTGRFDHPAADDCAFGDEPLRTELQCRAQFVVDAAEPAAAP